MNVQSVGRPSARALTFSSTTLSIPGRGPTCAWSVAKPSAGNHILPSTSVRTVERSLISAVNADRLLPTGPPLFCITECILERNLLCAKSVAKPFETDELSIVTTSSTQERSRISAQSVARPSTNGPTSHGTSRFTRE